MDTDYFVCSIILSLKKTELHKRLKKTSLAVGISKGIRNTMCHACSMPTHIWVKLDVAV